MDNKENKKDKVDMPPPIANTIPETILSVIKFNKTKAPHVMTAKYTDINKNIINDLLGIFISF